MVKSKKGINLLRLLVLVCCIVSFRNTAFGLKEYIFKNNIWIAYAISAVFQGIVAVISLQYRRIMRAYGKFQSPNGNPLRKKWINLVSFVALVAFSMSIFFDFVYIVNSTYAITRGADQKADITMPLADIQSEIFEWLIPAKERCLNEVETNLEAVMRDAKESGGGVYVKDWEDYWSDEKAKYDTSHLKPKMNYAVYDVASAYGAHRNGKAEQALMTAEQINDFKNAYAAYDVHEYVLKAVDAATVMKSEALNESAIDRIKAFMAEIKEHLEGLISLEKGEENYKDKTSYAGMEDIFSQLKAQEEARVEDENSWKSQLAAGTAILYSELSELRINRCKEAIADINEYMLYIESVTEDPKYNGALIISKLSEFEETDIKELEAITSKIGQGLFTEQDSSDKIKNYQNLRSSVSYYVPLKNIDFIIRGFDFGENGFNEEKVKGQIDSLVGWLSSVSMSKDVDKSQISKSVHKLIALEDIYLNKKNSLIEALNHLLQDRNKKYAKVIGEGNDYSSSHSTVLLAWIALFFAVLVDFTSLFLGNIVQKWEEEKGA